MHSTLAARHLVDETHVYIVQTGGNPVIAQGEGSNQPLVTDLNQLSVALPCKVADRPCEFVLHKLKNETHNKISYQLDSMHKRRHPSIIYIVTTSTILQ